MDHYRRPDSETGCVVLFVAILLALFALAFLGPWLATHLTAPMLQLLEFLT